MSDRKLQITLFLVLFFSFGYFYQGGGANQNARLDQIRSMVELGQFNLKPFAGSHDIVRIKGKVYPNKAPGISLIGVVPYFLVSRLKSLIVEMSSTTFYHLFSCYLVTVLVVGLPSAWGGLIFYRLLGLFHQSPVPRLICTLALFLGTPAFAYATALYGHMLGLVLALVCFYLLYKYLVLRPAAPHARFFLFLAGLSGSAAVVVEYGTVIIVVVLSLYCLTRALLNSLQRGKLFVFFLLGALIPAVIMGLYNYRVFGSPFYVAYFNKSGLHAGYHGRPQKFFQLGPKTVHTLFQISFGPFRGFFHLAPFLIVAFPGIYYFARKGGSISLLLTLWVLVLTYFFLTLLYPYWYGGKALGPRHSMEVLPYLVLLGFFFVIRYPRLSAVLAAGSIFFMLAATSVRPEEYVAHPFRDLYFYSFLHGALSIRGEPTFIQAGSFNSFNLGEVAGLSGQLSLAPLYLVWFTGGLFMIKFKRKKPTAGSGRAVPGINPGWLKMTFGLLLVILVVQVVSLVNQSKLRGRLEDLSGANAFKVPAAEAPLSHIQSQLTTGPFLAMWELLQPFSAGDRIEVKIQHAVAGKRGGFYMVAYGDKNKDGKPDVELARSPYLKARNAGEWSQWAFPAPEGRLFVGNAWRDEARVFYGRTGWKKQKLSSTMYFSRQGPPVLTTGPRSINMTVEVIKPDKDEITSIKQ